MNTQSPKEIVEKAAGEIAEAKQAQKKPPPPVKGEGDKHTCPACGVVS